MTYLDDIWYVSGARSGVAHAEFWAWQMPFKYLICIIYAKFVRSISGSGGIEKSHSCKWAKWIQWHALPLIQQSTQQWNKGYYPNLHGWDFSIPPLPHFLGTVCPTWMIFGMWAGLGPNMRMVTLMEVKGHQRSNGVNYVLWLPYLVKRSADASWEWWWPWWRSKVIRGQMW